MGQISVADPDSDDTLPFSSGPEIVKKKLADLGYDRRMGEADFERFAHILSTKQPLLDSYLHTDFQQARRLHRMVNRVVDDSYDDDEEEETSGGFGVSSHSPGDLGNLRPQAFDTEPVDLDEGIVEDGELLEDSQLMFNKELSLKEDGQHVLRVKLIVSETSKSNWERSLKKLISPFVNLTSHSPQFGMFHIALGIGPWKIEWNNSSLCIPRTITGRAAVLCADIGEIATVNNLELVRQALGDVIVKWNTSMFYCQKGGNTAHGRGNCQEFIEEILQRIGFRGTNVFSPSVDRFIRRLRNRGMCNMTLSPDGEFAEAFGIEAEVTFETHEQLDAFYSELVVQDPEFQSHFRDEYRLLKSYDRAFWMRWMKLSPMLNREITEEERAEIRTYQPRFNEDEDGQQVCPFGDPALFSILPMRVKRV